MDTEFTRVEDVMRTSLHIISGLATVQSAVEEMSRHHVSSLIIERRQEGDEYGVVTVQDIASNVVAINRSAARTSVYEIMTKPALTISAEMNVKYAIRLLARLGVSRALVMSGRELVGLVTLRDLVLSFAQREEGGSEAGA
jgi:signal-transduction protein with cAMP-binding, CBS, and nucleotidyltransferase domain